MICKFYFRLASVFVFLTKPALLDDKRQMLLLVGSLALLGKLAIWPPLPPPPPPPPPSPGPPPPSPQPPPPGMVIDDDVRDAVSRMSIEQKVGQMTQIDVTAIVSYVGDCPTGFLWEDRVNCQPVLDREKLRSWLRQFHIGALLNTPYSSGCIGEVCGWTAAQFRSFVREVQLEAQKEGVPPLLYGLDSVHGAGYVLGATVLPHQLALGATFSRERASQVRMCPAIRRAR